MKRITVFCGSRRGASTVYEEAAKALGRELAKRNITLVYGGGSVGIMGAIAASVMEAGGEVIGVIPTFLEQKEKSAQRITELIVVDSMHERKAKMNELADGFITLPGGAGTLEEFFEIFTWAQLGLHEKPIGLLNVNGYYDPLIQLFQHMTDEDFLHGVFRSMVLVDDDPVRLIERFYRYTPPKVTEYLSDEEET